MLNLWKTLKDAVTTARRQLHVEAAMESDPHLRDIEFQQRSLDENLAALHKALAHEDIYRLPWYLLLGGESAGKTSLATCFNHSVPLSHPARGIDGAGRVGANERDSVQWWLGHEALLIDTPGKFVTQPQVSPIHARRWRHLLGWLGENRSQRALDGIVLTVDLAKLISQSPQARKEAQTSIRLRLDELTQALGMRVPVHVVFSKIDLLEGFDAFLGHLPGALRDEVLGFTFSLHSATGQDAWMEEFDRHYTRFVTRLNEHMFEALGDPGMSRQRRDLFTLSRQLSGIRHLLSVFLLNALGAGRHARSALVRGVYFSSVRQQGMLLKRFAEAAGKSHGVDAPTMVERVGRILKQYARERLPRPQDLRNEYLYRPAADTDDRAPIRWP